MCRIKINNTSAPVAKILNAADTNDSKKDALNYYKNVFSRLGILTSAPGIEAVQAIYSLGMGLGMRESSGKYCEGWDKSAGSNRPSSAAESGTFQVSYDSMAASSELKKLYLPENENNNDATYDARVIQLKYQKEDSPLNTTEHINPKHFADIRKRLGPKFLANMLYKHNIPYAEIVALATALNDNEKYKEHEMQELKKDLYNEAGLVSLLKSMAPVNDIVA